MLKRKKELKISFLTIEILNIVELIIGLCGFFCGWSIHQRMDRFIWALMEIISIIVVYFSAIALESSAVERAQNKRRISSKEYYKLTISLDNPIFRCNLFNIILTIISTIPIIVFLFF